MTGSRSHIALLALACAAAATAAIAHVRDFAVACWRIGRSWYERCFDYVIRRIKPARANAMNLSAWRRCLERAEAGSAQRTEKRRPLVSPRWRLCSSV